MDTRSSDELLRKEPQQKEKEGKSKLQQQLSKLVEDTQAQQTLKWRSTWIRHLQSKVGSGHTSSEQGSNTSSAQGSAAELVSQGAQKLPTNDKHHAGEEIQIVEGVRSGIFDGPKKGARGCPTVVGMDPTQLKSEEARVFLRRKLPKRLENEVFVILGNTEQDIDWLLDQMSDEAMV